MPGCGAPQAGQHLVIRYLGKAAVELADGEEHGRRPDAHQIVSVSADSLLPSGRRDGHGEHDPCRPMCPCDLAGGAGRGPGSDAVIDHYGHPPVQWKARPLRPVTRGMGFHRGLLPRDDSRQLLLRYPGRPDDLAVDDPRPAFPDRAHGQLGMPRDPELAHHYDIQRPTQRPSHLRRYRDASPRQAQYHDRLAAQIPQPGGESPPGIITISENHIDPPITSLLSTRANA